MPYLKQLVSGLPKSQEVALVDLMGGSLTYDQLTLQLNLLAEALRNLSNSKALVGICFKKKTYSIQAIGACILADKAYVPLDAYGAPARNNTIIENCRLEAILLDKESYLQLHVKNAPEAVTHLGNFLLVRLPFSNKPQDQPLLACILHTSGSTGFPKGVMITHDNIKAFVEWCKINFNLTMPQNMLSLAPLHFDLSIFDLFIAWSTHSTLYVLEHQETKNPMLICQKLSEWHINSIYSTPSLYLSLLTYGKLHKYDFKHLRLVLTAGEPIQSSTIRALASCWEHADFYNLYGPTETNVVTYYKIENPLQVSDPIPIGIVCDYAEVKVVQDTLWISGETLSPGYYLNVPLTEQSFVKSENKTWYQSGDLVGIDGNSKFIFNGRSDRMVKRRGYRIELDEIQVAFAKLSGVTNCAVISIRKNEDQIITFYTANETLSDEYWRQNLLYYLPLYMIPDKVIKIDFMPLTSSGKINFQVLKSMIP